MHRRCHRCSRQQIHGPDLHNATTLLPTLLLSCLARLLWSVLLKDFTVLMQQQQKKDAQKHGCVLQTLQKDYVLTSIMKAQPSLQSWI